jgi:signal transduction histidine kinase
MDNLVLYVDDDPSNLVVFETLCEGRFAIETAESGQDALDILNRRQVAVLLADQRMPGMTGVELAERVRVDYPEVVRILITAYQDLQEAVEAINRGHVRSYLRKPWNQSELLATLSEAIDTYKTSARIRELERHMLATERVYALGVVTAGVSHELRGPLGVVQSTCSSLEAKLRETRSLVTSEKTDEATSSLEELEELLRSQNESIAAMVEICNGLTLSGARSPEKSQICDLKEVVALAARTSLASFQGRGRLTLSLDDNVLVRGNRYKIGQVVLNLIVNAFQALDPEGQNGSISAQLRKIDSSAVLEVSDNGSGMTERELRNIFHPFYTTKEHSGTGLGLAISSTIVNELGGLLECESEPNEGTLFRMTLALANDD